MCGSASCSYFYHDSDMNVRSIPYICVARVEYDSFFASCSFPPETRPAYLPSCELPCIRLASITWSYHSIDKTLTVCMCDESPLSAYSVATEAVLLSNEETGRTVDVLCVKWPK